MARVTPVIPLTIFSVMLLALLSAKVPTAAAFKCYLFPTADNTADPGKLTDCPVGFNTCGKVDATASGIKVVTRTCGGPPVTTITLGPNECQTVDAGALGKGTFCQCNTDSCNAAVPSGSISMFALLVAVVTPVAFSVGLLVR